MSRSNALPKRFSGTVVLTNLGLLAVVTGWTEHQQIE